MEVFNETMELLLHIPEEEISNLRKEKREYLLHVKEATKGFLTDYFQLYKSGDKKNANNVYSEWKSYIEIQGRNNPDLVPQIEKMSKPVYQVLKRIAEKDSDIRID